MLLIWMVVNMAFMTKTREATNYAGPFSGNVLGEDSKSNAYLIGGRLWILYLWNGVSCRFLPGKGLFKNKKAQKLSLQSWVEVVRRTHRHASANACIGALLRIMYLGLVKVLRIVDGDKKPAMGYIYEAMDRLKETISTSFANKEVHYRKAFEIIDRRWDFQLHRPLHAAGHFLNPQWFYDKSKNVDCEEIRTGLSACIRRLVPDLRIQDAIADELDLYQKEVRMFGDPMAIRHRSTKAPADWWVAYGSSAPNLQKFAIRVLSLTCSATGYIDESNEWLMGHMDGEEEPATNFVYVDDDLTWAAVDIASGASEPAYPTRASTSRGSVQGSTSAPKGKGTAHTSTSGSKAYGLIDEDYEEDIGLSEDDGVNEELGIDVDDDEDDEDDY
ncbi:hypothetical protein Tco_0882406 [Tanacetum coccineum]